LADSRGVWRPRWRWVVRDGRVQIPRHIEEKPPYSTAPATAAR